ncbi:hypothetical protein [Pararhizobium arenae]|uniref:hypothetical protein n=1 Tax=Pararhizobium arenae TaxID=1856850 RepID=UPI00094B303D|nr:hypothetical protein [Pararhizobium arenae]
MTNESDKDRIEKDAKGQFAKSQADRRATGVASAKPTVITGSEDATAHSKAPGKKRPTRDFDINYDVTEPDRS